ncbi:Peptidyl-prolyl cis-trans isomerase FKBP11 [Sciurus carolinensis]|uniref:Peptidyl-prolyl cis-trans isomerase FKBP11 n=1 Tax=Sciurus carolinensis TaxID=30640 RepID=A0AA41MVW8_SCICA|nr:Peptidyl-prolyl cis-trans isomerase FKBP11 [Sciurus carolinensis]
MTLRPLFLPLHLLLLLLSGAVCRADPGFEAESPVRTLQVETLGTLVDGRIIDTSLTRDPLVIELGQKQVIPADAVLQYDVELIALIRANYWQKLVKGILPLVGMAMVPGLLGLIGFHLYKKANTPKVSKKKLKEEKRNKSKKK